ncbi:hypothetical protein X975_24882, partial [Stegodyphus mimosarum]
MAIDNLLMMQKQLIIDFINFMKSSSYRKQLEHQIAKEKERSQQLKRHSSHLKKVVSGLREE